MTRFYLSAIITVLIASSHAIFAKVSAEGGGSYRPPAPKATPAPAPRPAAPVMRAEGGGSYTPPKATTPPVAPRPAAPVIRAEGGGGYVPAAPPKVTPPPATATATPQTPAPNPSRPVIRAEGGGGYVPVAPPKVTPPTTPAPTPSRPTARAEGGGGYVPPTPPVPKLTPAQEKTKFEIERYAKNNGYTPEQTAALVYRSMTPEKQRNADAAAAAAAREKLTGMTAAQEKTKFEIERYAKNNGYTPEQTAALVYRSMTTTKQREADAQKAKIAADAKHDALIAKMEQYDNKPVIPKSSIDPLLGKSQAEIQAWAKARGLSIQETKDLLKDYKTQTPVTGGAPSTGPAPSSDRLQQDYATVSRYNAMALAYCKSGQVTSGCEQFQVKTIVETGSRGNPVPTTYGIGYMSSSSAEFEALNKNAINNQVKGYVTWNGNTSTTPLDAKGPCKGVPNCIVGNDGKPIKIDVKQAAAEAFRAGEHADYSKPGTAPAASYATATVQIVDKYGNRQSVPVDLWAKLIKSGQISDATFVNGINQKTDTRSAQQTQLVAGQNGGTATMLFNPSDGFRTDSFNAVMHAFGQNGGEAATINTLTAMLTYANGDMNLHAHSQGTGIASLAVDKYKAQGGNTTDLTAIMAAPIRNIDSDIKTTYVVDNKFGMDTVNTLLNSLGSSQICTGSGRGQRCRNAESTGGGPNQQTITVTNATSAHNGANVIAPYEGSGANIVDGNWQTTIAPASFLVSPGTTLVNVAGGLAINPYNPTPFTPITGTQTPSATATPVANPTPAAPTATGTPRPPTTPMNNRFYHAPPPVRVVTSSQLPVGGQEYIPTMTPTPPAP